MTNSVIRQTSTGPFGQGPVEGGKPGQGPVITQAQTGLPLPEAVIALVQRGVEEGEQFLSRLQSEWADPEGPYAAPRALLVVATVDGEAAGIAGLIRDPFLNDPRTGRLRHVYVAPPFRRRGVAEAMVRTCLASAQPAFNRVRLRTANPHAAQLYERYGFVARPDEPDATHVLDLPNRHR